MYQKPEKGRSVDTSAEVVQLAKWRWNGQQWKIWQGYPVKNPPRHTGDYVGEIYDDTPELAVAGSALKAVKSRREVPEYMILGDDVSEKEFTAYCEKLKACKSKGYPLTKKQEEQLSVYTSNAGYFLDRVKALKASAEESNIPNRIEQWSRIMEAFQQLPRHPVFTRDIDAGELAAQGNRGTTLDVVTRIKEGIGHVRTFKDLNRGGGAGSYVRFISDKKDDPENSEFLDTGSIAKSGVTIIYDAKSVIKDNSAPGGMVFNQQDSAGRIFGTNRKSEEELKRTSRRSEKILGRANPSYYLRESSPDIPLIPLRDEHIMNNAIKGMRIMLDQADKQTAKEEYNEVVLFSNAKICNVKAILIHRPSSGKGSPPDCITIPKVQRERFEKKQDLEMKKNNEAVRNATILINKYEEEKKQLQGTSLMNPAAKGRIVELDTMISKEIDNLCNLKLFRPKPVLTNRFVNKREITTSRNLRNPGNWENYTIPAEIKQWEKQTGLGGVPIKYLITLVNPSQYTRAQLPDLADVIWKMGKQEWESDKQNEKNKSCLLVLNRAQSADLSIKGRAITFNDTLSRTDMRQRISKHSDEGDSFVRILMENNCLIHAISRAILRRDATFEEIKEIRTHVLARGFPVGSMLVASPAILDIIRTVLRVQNGIKVIYLDGTEDDYLNGPHQVTIFHRSDHFSNVPF
jgi:hypothetical protein